MKKNRIRHLAVALFISVFFSAAFFISVFFFGCLLPTEEEEKREEAIQEKLRFRLVESQDLTRQAHGFRIYIYILQDTITEKCYMYVHRAGGGTEVPCR